MFDEKQYTRLDHEDGRVEFIPIKAKGLWEPVKGEKYFYVNFIGEVISEVAAGRSMDALIGTHGNCFQHHASARTASELAARANKFIAAAVQSDFNAGAFDAKERPFTVCVDLQGKLGWCEGACLAQPAYVHTKEQVMEMLRILTAENWK